MIKVFDSNETLFNHNGIKILKPIKCDVFKEDNGDYYIELEDSIENIEYYQPNMIITCPTPFPEGVQAFRISNPVKNLSKISVKAKHVYFDRANYIIDDRYIIDKNCGYALDYLNNNTDIQSPFKTSSNITSNNTYRVVRKSLQESDEAILERWGGHIVRNNFKVAINSSIGEDRGVTLKYAKNISNIKAEETWDDVVTKILPVGKDGLLLPEKYLQIEEKLYDIPFTKVITFDQDLDEQDYATKQAYQEALIQNLRSQATSFLNDNKYPKVNYSLSAHLDKITDVGDTIYVEHPKLEIALTTNVISVKWNAISKKYKTIEFGNFRNTLKNLIKDINNSSKQIATEISNETKAILEDELKKATSDIWNILGNSYAIYEGDKILIVDKLPKEEATNVMIINSGGIGFSTNGINGNFNSAWTIDGTLDMQQINVINLVADMIKGGTLKLGGENNINGTIEIYDANSNLIGRIDKDGFLITVNGKKDSLNNVLTQVAQTMDTIQQQISGEYGMDREVSGLNQVFIEDALKYYPLQLKISGYSNTRHLLYPVFYPGADIFSLAYKEPELTQITICVDSQDRDNSTENLKEYPITINEPLRSLGSIKDELEISISNEGEITGSITRYLKYTGSKIAKLDKPIVEPITTPKIELLEHSNYVYIKEQPNYQIYIKYLLYSQTNEFYATKIELNTSRKQTENSITDMVSKTYSTKDELAKEKSERVQTFDSIKEEVSKKADDEEIKTLVKTTAGSIDIELSKKTDKEKIVTTINASTEGVKIGASKLDVDAIATFTNSKLATAGSTTINGSNITTGTIDASKATIKNINASNITSGTISGDKISGGTITGTTINTDKNLTVGNNVYIGQNQASNADLIKYLYFSENAYIRRWIFSSIGKNYLCIHSDLNTRLECGSGNVNVMDGNIQMSHTPTILSDRRLKQNIENIDVSWIDKLQVKEFEYITTPDKKQIGLIAQDYAEESYSKYFLDEIINENGESYYSIAYGNITNALIKYCQELNNKVKNLEAKIKELESDK